MNTTTQDPPRERLVAERMRRRWTQLEVADQLGTTPGNVSRWERGITSPGPYFRRKLCELFGSSAQELGLTWDESDDDIRHYAQASTLAASIQRDVSARSSLFFTSHEDLLALLHTLMRPDITKALPSVFEESGADELDLSKQDNENQGQLAQAVTQDPQIGSNLVLIPDNAGVVVLVVLNGNVCSRPSSLSKRLYHRQITHTEDCCNEDTAMQETFRERQGA
jgi:transcriptional regulator with XRE-family HTH domain